jgi:putative tryptophan/tyrosine transport system substrate-binding protein
MSAFTADLVGNQPAALVAKTATTTLPIVVVTGYDPVRDGLVSSLNRPGGNVTGVIFLSSTLGAKRLQLLGQLAPKATKIAVLVSPDTVEERIDVQAAAQTVGQQLLIIEVSSERDFDSLAPSGLLNRAAQFGQPSVVGHPVPHAQAWYDTRP